MVNQNNGTLAIAGTFTQTGGSFNYGGGSITGSPVLTSVALAPSPGGPTPASFAVKGSSSLTAGVAANVTVWIQGSNAAGAATLTAANGFINAGTIRLESIEAGWGSYLIVTAGAITNTGTITVSAGAGGPRIIRASVTNQGTINVNADLSLSMFSEYVSTTVQ